MRSVLSDFAATSHYRNATKPAFQMNPKIAGVTAPWRSLIRLILARQGINIP
ncbi:MAG: hypothetical protein GY820_33945 [Gammaproteobacteria bacterium]|nr:hypothetical protein [Gammaproteobacteria bacterium]